MTKTLFDDEPAAKPKVTALAPWFGSNRMLASEVGKMLRGCKWVGVVFSGGFSEVLHIDAPTIVCNDLHRDIINLANVIAIPAGREWLATEAARMPFHPDVLLKAQTICKQPWEGETPDAERALWYFVAVWMNRSAKAGTDGEFSGNLPIRWNANGGDSNTRYRSAIASLDPWAPTLERCNFSTLDFRDFLRNCLKNDHKKHGIYADAPFPDDGDGYRHKFSREDHIDLAIGLSEFRYSKVVIRFYDHPLIRELYPEGDRWAWHRLKGRDQANNGEKPEVLIINGPSHVEAADARGMPCDRRQDSRGD